MNTLKKGLLFIFLFISCNSFAQVTFLKTMGGSGHDYPEKIEKTNDGGYIIAGYSNSFSTDHFYLVKIDSLFNIQWTRHYGGTVYDVGQGVQQTADGGYVICGATYSFNSQPYGDIMLIKTDAFGNVSWCKHYGGSGTAATS
jgi:hypothetical protein